VGDRDGDGGGEGVAGSCSINHAAASRFIRRQDAFLIGCLGDARQEIAQTKELERVLFARAVKLPNDDVEQELVT
jgi:hypothetical protein